MSKTKKLKNAFTTIAKSAQKYASLTKAAQDWQATAEKAKADILAAAKKLRESAKTDAEKDFWSEFEALTHNGELALTLAGAKIADSHAKTIDKRYAQLEKQLTAAKKEAAKAAEQAKKDEAAKKAAEKKAAAEKKKADAKAAKDAANAPKETAASTTAAETPATETAPVEAGTAKQVDLTEMLDKAQTQTTFPVAP